MYPILFRIPLPHMPLKLWWGLVAVAAIALVYAALSQRRGEKSGAVASVVVAALAAGAAFKWKTIVYEAPNIPIYSYGVMLGLSLVIGWYLTLTLAEKDGLPKETMANCYVITAVAAIVGSRVLYILTNLDEFKSMSDLLALRKGGLVAYGGFIGGFLGSWAYLASKKIRLMPWADAAVPSLASGLLVTRIGCFLFGCDFGKQLPDGAPGFLKKLGTFPHWPTGTLENGDGSPAYVRHLDSLHGKLHEQVLATNHSLPVHPTQIYESLVGLSLLALLLWQRKHIKFRGQVFFLFVFAYGVLRFCLEIIRDDVERGEYGPVLAEHVIVPACLLLLSIGFVFGISLGITNLRARTIARVLAFVPPVVAYVLLAPKSFAQREPPVQLSTSQWIALVTALMVSYFYAAYWQDARKRPVMAMALGEGATVEDDVAKKEPAADDEEERAEDADGESEAEAREQAKKKKKKKIKRAEDATTAKPAEAVVEDDAPDGKIVPEPT